MKSKFDRTYIVLTLLFMLVEVNQAGSYLLYGEAQLVGGYRSIDHQTIFYSHQAQDVMQKPSLGIDYLQKFSGSSGDKGSLAVQARLAFNLNHGHTIEPQLYNAYYRIRTDWGYIRMGHHRPSQGLSAYFDNHGLLLNTLSMEHYGFDRDWGLGWSYDTPWGELGLSVTTGSGMRLDLKGNYWIAFRSGYGILNLDNRTIGFSLAGGRRLETMGYDLMYNTPINSIQMIMDMTWLLSRFEHRLEGGIRHEQEKDDWAVWYCLTLNLMEENRLKIDFQPQWNYNKRHYSQVATVISYQWTPSLTVRGMYQYQDHPDDHRWIAQLYYYANL